MDVQPLTVLLVEDDPDHADLVSHYLELLDEPRVRIVHADRLGAGMDRARSGEVDLVLLDLQLPDSTFWETVERMTEAAPHVPIIILTSLGDLDLALETMQRGAQDYLVKSELSGEILARSIRYALERKRALLSVEREREQMRWVLASVMEGMQPQLTEAHRLIAQLGHDHPLSEEAQAVAHRAEDIVGRVAQVAEEIARRAREEAGGG